NTEYQLADLFTKALGRDRIEFLINKLEMRSFTPETLKQLMDKVNETMETTIEQQVVMDEALVPSAQRCPFYKAFLVTADVPEIYMKEFWATANVHHHSIRFKMDNKKHIVNLESFREMLHIYPRIPGQAFAELPFEEEILDFIRFLGHSETIRTLTDVNINKLYQPWRSFAAVINKWLTGKTSGYDSLRLSQAQILWRLYHKQNVDYAFLIWEDFVYQVEHKNHKKSNEMYYLRFTKVIIHHFMSKDLSIPRRNKVNWHYVRDDFIFSMIKLVSRHQTTQQFGAMLLIELTNEEIRNSKEYKEYYAIATGEATPKPKASARRTRGGSDTSITPLTVVATPKLTVVAKGKQTAKAPKAKSLSPLSEVAMIEAEQVKLVLKRSRQQMHISQPGGSGTDEGTGSKPGVPDVPTNESEEELSWNSSDDEETRDEESFDPIPRTPESSKDEGDGEEDQGLNVDEEEHVKEEEEDELYRDMNEAVRVAVQIQLDRLRDEAQKKNDEFLRSVDENMKKIIKEQVKDQVKVQVSKILPRIEQAVNEQLEAEVLTRSSHSSRTYYVFAADLSKMELKEDAMKMLIRMKDPPLDQTGGQREGKETESASTLSEPATKSAGRSTTGSKSRQASASESAFAEEPMQTTSQMEEPSHLEFDNGVEDQPIVQSSQHPEWFSQPQKPLTPDRDWNKTLLAVHGSIQPWINELERQADTHSSFNELMDTPSDFSNFLMNWLRVDTLTPELLVGPTYELMKGSCKSLIELEYHLEEVYKATADQLDWVNPEGQQYPHNLLQPLLLIPDNRGRRVIPFAHFINNDLEYLRGSASSRKYTTFVTKTKAVDYGHIKWIEDLVPRTMWIQKPVDYDKYALLGVSHWGRKRQQFYGFAVNRESARDVYSKRRIIAVTKLKIVEWHSYKHLDWITVQRDDDKLYKFKEGDFKMLRLQDIEDMLLLLVQGKLTNLTVEECFAFNVSLRMFTRSIVIQRRMEDLQLGVESYQKKLNLTKPDMYRADLKRKDAYTAYFNPSGFIYQKKYKKNRLMQIDELHKFSDGTLIDVRTALDDRLKGIRMQYLPQTIWRRSDKDRAAAMIQAIEKRLKKAQD
nr:hypothetical protein [Tanacetum cinerariifolium]